MNEVPLKLWIILREDITYTYNRMLNIGIESIKLIENDTIYKKWRSEGSKTKTYMVFNLHFLDIIEYNLVLNGYKFEWIYSNRTPVGIVVYPIREYLTDGILKSSLTLDEYSKHRLTLFRDEEN